ncbi:MAG: trigger factor, partial [Acidobacteriota bacterium]
VVQDYRRQAHMPGFRKGKVPAKLLRKRFKSEIDREVTERLAPRYWQQAEAEKDLDVLLPPQLEEINMEEGEAMTLVAVVETRPQITLADVENFDLPEDSADPSAEEISDSLNDLRRSFAEWQTVDRPAAQGDLVVGTILSLDEEPPAAEEEGEEEGGIDVPDPKPLHFEIGGSHGDEELSLLLTGKSAGAEVEHVHRHGEGEEAQEDRYHIEISEIREQELPELDGDFAEKIGFETVEEVEEALAARLRNEKGEALRRARSEALLTQLRDRHPLPSLPEGVVQQESERIMRERMEQLVGQGVDLEKADIDWESAADSVRPVAERQVHERLVLDAIAKEQDLRLDEEKFEEFLAMAAAQQKVSSLALRQRLAEDGRLDPLRAQLLRDQTLGQLLGDLPKADESDEASSEVQDEA